MRHDGDSVIAARSERLGILTRPVRCACSIAAFRAASSRPTVRMEIGAVATVRVVIEGREFTDDVKSCGASRLLARGLSITSARNSCGPNPPMHTICDRAVATRARRSPRSR